MEIREYISADKEGCLQAFRTNVPDFFTNDEVGDFERFLDALSTGKRAGRTHFYVIVRDGEIVGCGGFGDKDDTGTISLAWGLVRRDFHKLNYGKALLTYRLEQIGVLYPSKPVFLDTTQFSYGFFEKYGFKVLKITPDSYAEGMHRYDMVRTG